MEMLYWSCASLYRWTKVHELLIQQRIRKDLLAQAVKESNAMLRYALCSYLVQRIYESYSTVMHKENSKSQGSLQ